MNIKAEERRKAKQKKQKELRTLQTVKKGKREGFTEMEIARALHQIQRTSAKTNAAFLAQRILREKIDPEFMVEVLKEAFKAELYLMVPERDENNKIIQDKPIKVWKAFPDWKVRQWAWETVANVCGFWFKEDRDNEQVPAIVMQTYNDMRNMSDGDLLKEAKRYGVEVPSESRVRIDGQGEYTEDTD
jgi:hypothetical protein